MKKSITDMHALAALHPGGTCHSSAYLGDTVKLQWGCSNGHTFEMAPGKVKAGQWCPRCRGRNANIEDMQQWARLHPKGECLADKYLGSDVPLMWRCEKGHEWDMPPAYVKAGNWCPLCRGKRATIEKLQSVAQTRGGNCLSPTYLGSQKHHLWECSEKHTWQTSAANVLHGSWCPICSGTVRKTIEEIKDLARMRGGECLSETYKNKEAKLRWKCSEGHEWDARSGAVRRGSWCPHCAGVARKTISDMQLLAQKHPGGACLSTEYAGDTVKLWWRCEVDHEWDMAPGAVKAGHWCPLCKGKRADIAKLQRLAAERGGKCLSPKYLGALQHHLWECDKGHTWSSAVNNIVTGYWCPECAGNRRLNIDMVRAFAREKGGECLSDSYRNNSDHLRWRCADGHEWETGFGSIQQGSWCPKCSGVGRITIVELQHLAQQRGGECLSAQVESGERHIKWRCSDGHIWTAIPNSIKVGRWCPECSAGQSERACRAILEKLLGIPFPKSPLGRLPWLKNSRGKSMELDGYCAQVGLAFEYHGRQHYEFLPHFHRNESALRQRIEDDQTKLELCELNGVRLITVPYWIEIESMETYLRGRLDQLGIYCEEGPPISLESIAGAIYARSRIDDLRRMVESRGGVLLSDSYLGPNRSHRVRCSQGHEWSTTPATLKKGSWCKRCSMTKAWVHRSAERGRLSSGDQPRLFEDSSEGL